MKVAGRLGSEVRAAFLGDDLSPEANVMPLFLMQGEHLRNDVTNMVKSSHSNIIPGPADCSAEIGQMALSLATATRKKQRTVMFALYRLLHAEALMSTLYDVSKAFPLPAIAGLRGVCDVRSVLDLWCRNGVEEALIQPVLLFPGKSLARLEQLADKASMDIIIAPPLTEHPDFSAWLAERFRQSL